MKTKFAISSLCFIVLAVIASSVGLHRKPRPNTAPTTRFKSSKPLHTNTTYDSKSTKDQDPASFPTSLQTAGQLPLNIENLIHRDVNPGEAKILLSRCESEIPDVSLRSRLSATIIASLCKQGLNNEAWKLISQDPGLVRSTQINFFFSNNKTATPADLSRMITDMTDSSDREHAIFGLIQGRPEVVLQMDSSLIPGETVDGRRMFEQSVTEALKRADLSQKIKDDLVERSIQLAASGKLESGYLSYILDSAHPDDLNAQWESLRKYSKSFDEKSLESLYAGLAQKMVVADLSKTMDMLSTDPDTKSSYPVLSAAVTKMFKTSPAAANTWVTNNLDRLDPATSQRIISCLVQVANQNQEFNTSRMWANRIIDPNVRKALLEQVDKREADNIKQPLK